MNWYDKAEAALEVDYQSGFITYQEYNDAIRELRNEYQQGLRKGRFGHEDAYDSY